MMQVLVVCVILFFGAAELWQWMQGMALPMPVWVAAGVVLAIASNLHHPMLLAWTASRQSQASVVPPAVTGASDRPAIPAASASVAPLTQLDAPTPISFTIRKMGDRQEDRSEDPA
jgi:hypothetical protein